MTTIDPRTTGPRPRLSRLWLGVEAVSRRPGLFSLSGLAVLATSVACTLVLPERYRAVVKVRATWEDENSGSRWSATDVSGHRLQEGGAHTLTRAVLERALADSQSMPQAGGRAPAAPDGSGPTLEAVTLAAENDGVFRIACVHREPTRAAHFANRLAEALVERAQMEHVRRRETSPSRILARIAAARRTMEAVETALGRLRERPPQGGRDERPVPSGVQRLDAERRVVVGHLLAARSRADQLRQAMESRAHAPGGEGAEVAGELEGLRAELSRLRERYTEEHPDVQALQRRVRQMESAVPPPKQTNPLSRSAPDTADLEAVDQEIAALEQRIQTIDSERVRLLHDTGSSPPREPTIGSLFAEYEAAQASYSALLGELERAEVVSRIQGPLARFEIVQRAEIPQAPYFPDRRLFALAGLVLGVILSLGLVLVAESRDPSIKGPEGLQETLPYSILAQIPLVEVRRSERRRSASSRQCPRTVIRPRMRDVSAREFRTPRRARGSGRS